MAPTKMPCKNNAAFSYTGKEMSPMGVGYCADAESVNKEMVGRDGKTWVVGVKNSTKMWMRAPEEMLARDEPVMPEIKPVVAEPEITPATEDELPPLEEIPNDEEETDLEDPFGWKPQSESAVTEEAKPETVIEAVVEPKKKAAGRPKKIKEVTEKIVETKAEVVEVKADEAEVVEAVVEPKKKAGRPKKIKTADEAVENDKTEVKKRGRPAKVKVEGEVEEKPKRKYTRKPKDTEENIEGNVVKKERKPRAKNEYNEFIGKVMKDLREKNKENKDLKTTDYMKMAIAEWKTYKISKTTEVVA